MITLKEKETDTIYYDVTWEDGCHTHKDIIEFKGFYTEDVKKAVFEYNLFLEYCYLDTKKDNTRREEIFKYFKEKYNISILIARFDVMFKQIFGEFDK